MTSAAASRNISVNVGGSATGQMIVGDHNLVVSADHGAVINVVQGERRAAPRPRASDSLPRPRDPVGMLDRHAEVEAATSAVRERQPVELHGQSGIGKTTLLNFLANHVDGIEFPDGIVCLSARRYEMEDVRQSLYEAFYESDLPFKPSEAALRLALRDKRALILLDDTTLPREDAEELLDIAPRCAVVIASPDRRLWRGEVLARGVRGLPPADALALAERELGRTVSDDERATLGAICASLEGVPLRVVQTMAMAREDNRSLADVARELGVSSPSGAAPPVAAAS
ncbi:MAG: NB-ARC domain-containing protein, partial [Gemmatimonadota bacterium]|nr:NB-ARC domain-containing protein [Gemmatimonadota bacterium]